MENKRFEQGQNVKWSSSSNASTKEKVGKIFFTIPAGQNVDWAFKRIFNPKHKYVEMFDGGTSRNHESYIVVVPSKSGRGKEKLYWPRVSALEIMTAADIKH